MFITMAGRQTHIFNQSLHFRQFAAQYQVLVQSFLSPALVDKQLAHSARFERRHFYMNMILSAAFKEGMNSDAR